MPKRLRPTAPIATDAVLVGDPGRALLLAQELLEQPKMSNHARGLWGYWGLTPEGRELTIQSTGMGGPSASIVLTDLVKLGVRRAVRVGTCTALDPRRKPAELLAVTEARAGTEAEEAILPDEELVARLAQEIAEGDWVAVVSIDTLSKDPASVLPEKVGALDMQTASLLRVGRALGVALATILIVAETASGELIADEDLENAAKRAGRLASAVLST